MFIIKNSIKNIFRYKNKYISFGILYLVIILAASVSVNIFIQMGKITNNIIKEYAGVLKIDTSIRSAADQRALRITKNELLKFKDNDYVDDVKFYRYIFDARYQKETAPELKKELHIGDDIVSWGVPLSPIIIYGYNMSLMHLVTDEFNLEKGRMFEKDDEAVIYKNRLYPSLDKNGWNDLDLGDKVVLKNNDGIYKEFTIVGIKEQDPNDNKDTYRYMIYTTLASSEYFDVIALDTKTSYPKTEFVTSTNDFINLGYETLIYLDSPDNYIPLKNVFQNKGVRIQSFFQDANALMNLTNSMQIWGMVFMAVTGIVIICLAIVSTNILLNTRKYEIAVLRSIGMKKKRLIMNYLIENLAFIWGITIIALITTQFIAPIFTREVFVGMKNLISIEMFENLIHGANLELFLINIGIVFCGTTAVVILSLILTCSNIIRFEPLKIFNKQY